jgi:Amidohydrolase family.
MVHIGNAPPRLEEILPLLEAGDIVSHALHGKPGGIYRDGRLLPEARAALDRGVLFDVGHGQASFSFATARRFLADGFLPYTISSDLWKGNETGPVFSLLHTMTKLLHLGMPLHEVIAATTSRAAAALRREAELGSLAVGRVADISLIRITEGEFPLTDSEGAVEMARYNLELAGTIRAGQVMAGEG